MHGVGIIAVLHELLNSEITAFVRNSAILFLMMLQLIKEI